jgi:hypothetical protein
MTHVVFSKCFQVHLVREREMQDIRDKITWTKSGRYKQELLDMQWSEGVADSMVENLARNFERVLVQMEFPCSSEVSLALDASSREVKYVFGVLGFPAKAFVLFVNKYGLRTIDDVYDNRHMIERIADDGISETCLWKVTCFISWYIEYLSDNEAEPDLVDVDFNENIWWSYYCYGMEEDDRLERPMFRGCMDARTMKEKNFCMYKEYSNFCELDLIKLAVS